MERQNENCGRSKNSSLVGRLFALIESSPNYLGYEQSDGYLLNNYTIRDGKNWSLITKLIWVWWPWAEFLFVELRPPVDILIGLVMLSSERFALENINVLEHETRCY